MTQGKRVSADFRHLNMRIAENIIAYPLLKDTFTLLGNSKCKVISALALKDAFHSLRLTKIPRNIVEFFLTLEAPHICIRECLLD